VSFRGEDDPRRGETPSGQVSTRAERDRGRRSRISPLLLLLAVLVLALVSVAAVLLLRSFGESVPGTSVAKDSIDSAGPEPRVQLTNAAGQVRVEGVDGSGSVEYEATRYAMAADPAAAKQRASEVPVDISREGSKVVIETDGGDDTGADYALELPTGGSVEVRSEAGDVEVSGLSGNVTVDAEAGDVTVRDVGGGIRVEAPQGDVTLANVNTDTGGVDIEVGSGDVFLEDLILGTLEAGVEAGTVTLSGRFSGGGRVSVETGDIVARLPAGDTRDLTLQTRVGSVLREPPDGGPGKQEQGS
jgi:Putative adhesin